MILPQPAALIPWENNKLIVSKDKIKNKTTMQTILIRNATLVNEGRVYGADVLIKNGFRK